MPETPHPSAIRLAHDYLAALALEGKAGPPEYCEVEGTNCVQLKINRAPNLNATLCFGFSDGARLRIWSDIQLAHGVPDETGRLISDLFEVERQLTKLVLFHAPIRVNR